MGESAFNWFDFGDGEIDSPELGVLEAIVDGFAVDEILFHQKNSDRFEMFLSDDLFFPHFD